LSHHFWIVLHTDAALQWTHATALTVTYNGARNMHGSTAFSAATGHHAIVSFFSFSQPHAWSKKWDHFFLLGNQGALHARMYLLHSLFQRIFLREHRSESK
jgi:hypothetical protein